ncbi:Methyltransferase type 11 [Mycolicibacterium rhodesiae JS60]|nr:Methyltransferase type 11 [Mycolicibacterium rhodesiae JS60]
MGITPEVGAQSEFGRLQSLGWEAPARDADGVRWLRRDGAQVSYPRDVLDTLSGDGGEGFWLDARADAVGEVLQEASIKTMWDVGAGSGAMAKRLGRYGVDVVSVEPLPEGALEIAHMGAEVFCGTLHDLDLPSGSLPAVGLFDVVEHLEDPADLLHEVARVLSPEGTLVVTVPAYQWLWSAEDEALGHFRRYSTTTLRHTLEQFQFTVLSARYCFASLVPPAALLRTVPYRLGRRSTPDEVLSRNSARMNPGAASRWAARVLALEAKAARRLPLPFGLSVLAVAQSRLVRRAK